MKAGASENRLRHFLSTGREYVTHWVIAGTIITLTGFSPDHWISDLLNHLAIPENLRREWLLAFDIRIGLVAVGVAIIAWDVLRRSRLPKQEVGLDSGEKTQNLVQMPNWSSSDQKQLQASDLASPALPDKPSIAVLPFQNMSGDPKQEYFADGMAEDLITSLSKVRWFFVISRNSSFTYKGKTVDLKQAARELGVRYVLEGSVRKADNRVRITAQLIDAVNGHHVWAERYDRELADIFAVQDEITEQVVAAIEPQLFAAEGIRAKRKPPESLDAWECVVRVLSLMNSRAKIDVIAAQELLRKAIALDPGYAQAYSLLSILTTYGVHAGWASPGDALAPASEAAHKALQLDVNEPWAHVAMGYVLVWSRRPAEAIVHFEKTLALNPNFAITHYMIAHALCFLGRGEEALDHADKAARLSPRDLLARGNAGVINSVRALACFFAGRYRDGIDFARKAIIESPSLIPAYRSLVVNCALAGEIEEAKGALQTLKHLQPDITLKWIEDVSPSVPEGRRKYVEGFRLAGLE